MNRSERLAVRALKLLGEGVFPSPVESDVTVIVRSTRSDWTAACVEVLQTCTAERVKLIVVADQSYDPELAGKDRLNLALAQIETDFFVLLDDGVIVTPHWLTRLLWTFHDDSAVGIAAPASNLDSDSDFCSGLDELFTFARKIAEQNSGMWEPVQSFRGTCFAGRKSVLDEIGGLDYSLQSHEARLLDWCLRAGSKGYLLALCKDAFVYVLQPAGADNFEDAEKTANRWVRFRNKWNLEESADPYSTIGNTEPPALIPLTPEALAPPLVSVVVLCFAASLRALQATLTSIEQQTYPNIEILFVCQGSPPRLTKSPRGLVAGLWIENPTQLHLALEAVLRLARGQYVAYLEAGYAYREDHLSQMVDAIHRQRATIGLAKTEGEDTSLSCVIHLHPRLTQWNFHLPFSQNGTCQLSPNTMPTSELVKIPELPIQKVKA